ncbi:P-loop containing nucleoside triphosphate hydrolase protein [Chiua virens]|nr:P-loop containing nucleoside triphosphate hydrolase protein [Chiua virens]
MSDEVSNKSNKEMKIDPTSGQAIDKADKKRKDKKKKPQDASKNEKPPPDIESPLKVAAPEKDRKHEKKSKKKSLERDNAADSQAVPVEQAAMDTDATVESKKDCKRKRRLEDDVNRAEEPSASPPKKQKKNKRDKHVESEPFGQTSTPAVSSEDTHTVIIPTNPTDAAAFLTKHSITIHTPPSLLSVVPVISFDQLQIPEALKVAFKDFKEPTPIQACAWPPALHGHDCSGYCRDRKVCPVDTICSRTFEHLLRKIDWSWNSGKTLAFGIPALSRLISASDTKQSKKSKSKSSSSVSVLVVAPTRELALQTHDALSTLGAPFNISSVAVFGGVDKAPQIKALRSEGKGEKGTRIVVGTPGRILDLVNEGACDLSRVNYLVLDEADRMLDKGFENDIRKIISFTMQGSGRQTMMCTYQSITPVSHSNTPATLPVSATWPESVRRLASTFQRDPVRVTVGSDDLTANSHVEQIIEVFDDPREKECLSFGKTLKTLSHKKTSTKGSPDSRVLVFALYKKEASRVESMLRQHGYSVGALHGDMPQSARMNALEKFKTGETGMLVATDVACERIGYSKRWSRHQLYLPIDH